MHPLVEGLHVRARITVVQAEHGNGVAHRGELGGGAAADPLAGGIRPQKVGVRPFQLL